MWTVESGSISGDTINKDLMPVFDIIRKKFHCPLSFFRSKKQSVLKHAISPKIIQNAMQIKLQLQGTPLKGHEALAYVNFPNDELHMCNLLLKT